MSGRIIGEADVMSNPSYLLKVCEANLEVRTQNTLIWADIIYMAELTQRTEAELLKIRNFGSKGLLQVYDIISSLDLDLGTEIIFEGPKAEFRIRLDKAHEKIYAGLTPEMKLVACTKKKIFDQLELPSELASKIESKPLLSLAIRQLLGAQEICTREGLSQAEILAVLKVPSAMRLSERNAHLDMK